MLVNGCAHMQRNTQVEGGVQRIDYTNGSKGGKKTKMRAAFVPNPETCEAVLQS